MWWNLRLRGHYTITLDTKVYKLYIATNMVNQYKYVGLTSMSLKARAYAHKYEASLGETSSFKIAIRSYGIESFNFEEILSGLSLEEAAEAEKKYINMYRTFIGFSDCKGYNSTLGGEGIHYVNNEYNWIVQFRDSGEFIKIHRSLRAAEADTGITRVGIANACDGKAISCGGFLWRRYRNIDKLEVNGEKIGRDRIIKSVTKFSLEGDNLGSYESLKDAADANNCEASTIAKVCRGKLKSTGGFQWRYGIIHGNIGAINTKKSKTRHIQMITSSGEVIAEYESIVEAAKQNGITAKYLSRVVNSGSSIKGVYFRATEYKHKRKIVQIDCDNKEINVYDSASEASKICKIDRGAIYNCCVGKAKTAGGYIWKYKDM